MKRKKKPNYINKKKTKSVYSNFLGPNINKNINSNQTPNTDIKINKKEEEKIPKYTQNIENKEKEKKKTDDVKKDEKINIKQDIDYIPYSCIPQLDEKGNDKSFPNESIQKIINNNERKIPFKKKAQNLNDTDLQINKEYEVFYSIEDYKCQLDIFEQGYMELDRYSDIKPYKYNSVKISTKKKYINASPINVRDKKNLFISTQGPTPNTIEDFWTMVEDYDCNVVVMLCKLFEDGRKKCENYWEEKMNKYEIKIIKEDNLNMRVIRELNLKNKSTKKEKIVYQIHFTGWPDHGIPDTSNGEVFDVFKAINKKVDELNKDGKPIIVHCSAGVGRTGTFVSMYLLEKEILKQINDKKDIIRINVFNLVRKIKEMRMYMVQTPIQYKFVYLYVRYLLEKYNI